MNPSKSRAVLFAALLAVPAIAQEPPKPAPAPAPAPAPQQDPRAELKERMAGRYPLLEQLRDAGKIGETPQGEVKVRGNGTEQADPKDAAKGTIAAFVDAENKDRRAVYELIAKQEKTTAAEVGKQNGLRNLDKAKPDHWIEVKGQWVQRKSIRAEKK